MGANESRESSRKEGGGVDVGHSKLSTGEKVAAVAVGAVALLGAGLAYAASSTGEKVAAVAVGAVALLGAGLAYAASASKGDERKTMKAPGRNGQRIFRKDFERDPSRHFKDIRRK